MKKGLKLILSLIVAFSVVGCSSGGKGKPTIVLYSSAEDFRNEHYQKRLNEQFPDYNISVQYVSTGNTAAKIKSSGKSIEADIIIELEHTYSQQLEENFYTLDDSLYAEVMDEFIPESKKYVPTIRYSGAIIINEEVLKAKGLDVPTSYQDLLDPKYEGLISMPNPKASGTGYMFLKNLVNVMGEEEAFAYFDQLSKNILQYTSSGSGPVNALVQKEAAIGLGMTFQAVEEINKGANLTITTFSEGAPWTTNDTSIIEGRQDKEGVKEVFEFFVNTLIRENAELYMPEPVLKDQTSSIENYPTNIQYGDMSNNTVEVRENLLAKWKY